MGKKTTSITWQGQEVVPPTQAEMVASQIALAEDAARRETAARVLYDSLPAGDPRLHGALEDITRFASDQKHFRRAANFHRERHMEEQRALLAAETRQAEAARRLAEGLPLVDREVGADDGDEEEHESAWAAIGGAVAGGRR